MSVTERNGAPSVRARGAGRSFEVAGVAVTAATPPYPEPACVANTCLGEGDTGVVWLTKADALALDPQERFPSYVVNLKLADPAAAPAFVRERNPPADAPSGTSASEPPPALLQSWQDIRDASGNVVKNQRRVLLTGAWLLSLLAIASVAVLVGGRMAGPGCSRPSAAPPRWSRPCCSPSTWPWPCSRRRRDSRSAG